MQSDKPVFLIDLDGVCAILHERWLAAYNADYNQTMTYADLTTWGWHEIVVPECGTKIYDYLNRPGFFRDLPVMPGCVESLARLVEVVELVVITSTHHGHGCADKLAWVEKYLPMVPPRNFIATARKDLVYGDFRIDDYPGNLRGHNGRCILFDAPYNQGYTGAKRVRSWEEAEAYILARL